MPVLWLYILVRISFRESPLKHNEPRWEDLGGDMANLSLSLGLLYR